MSESAFGLSSKLAWVVAANSTDSNEAAPSSK